MASLNKVMLIGNLTRDPEVRHTPKGSAVCDLALAVNRTYMTDNNERVQEVTYVDVVFWGRQAEVVGQYLRKGSPIFIEGRLQLDTWDDRTTGQKRSKLRVVGEAMQLLGGNKRDGDEGGGYDGGEAPPPARSFGGNSGGGGGGGGYQQRGGGGGAPRQGNDGGGGGGGYQQRSPAPQRQAPPPPPAKDDDFGDGPITDGMDDDEIPF